MTNKIIKIKKDYSGLVFGKITVLGYDHSDSKSRAYFKCLCSCGKELIIRSDHLNTESNVSCGCARRKIKTGYKYRRYLDSLEGINTPVKHPITEDMRDKNTGRIVRKYDETIPKSTNMGVYKIQNIVNGRFYVGSCKYFPTRFGNHIQMLKNNRHTNRHLQEDYNIFGKENLVFKVLIYCDKINLKLYEQSFLDYYSGRGLLYNDLRAFGVSCNVT